MKKKIIFSLFLLTMLMFGMIFGTWAYFTKTFDSANNVAAAAIFDVDVVNKNGKTISDTEFDLGDKLYPGMEKKEVYSFEIRKNNTEVPVEYSVYLNKNGELFKTGTPVVVTLERNVEGQWVEVAQDFTFRPDYDIESFRIFVDWPHGNNDIDFQGLTGTLHLQVVATQVDEEEQTGSFYTGRLEFKVNPNSTTYKTSNKEVKFYKEGKNRVIEIFMGDEVAPDSNGFESKIGNIIITDEQDKSGEFVRVFTEREYFASEAQIWRVTNKSDSVDLSERGIIKLKKALGNYFLVESQELYDWFIANDPKNNP